MMKTLKIALDWTPNINHVGLFVAKELGLYKEQGIELDIISPFEDNYKMTPGKKLELGLSDFAIAPFETVISLNNKEAAVDAIAVYAILQEDLSSIVSLKTSNLDRPKLLDGKKYASYKARYEDFIVKEMVKNDGGMGNIELVYPEKLGIWNTLLENQADATWIFDNWEGVEAETKNIKLNKFKLSEFNIPYCYSPVIITKKSGLNTNKTAYGNFIKATRKGYLHAAENKSEAISILSNYLTNDDRNNIDLGHSLDITAPFFGNNNLCGLMDAERISLFLNWLINIQLESKDITNQLLFTNELLN